MQEDNIGEFVEKEYPIQEQEIKAKYMGQWTDWMSFEHFQKHYSERFPRLEAVEVRELLTKEQFKQLYPNVIL